ncbi:HlyD family secretion protein [Phyllobacterium bourgognense]|uniref:HlyD family secretion protein n=1 Tax=Phyllobacterium bourgognense TaxID=314236 RepID=A0A368YHD9_9HYPH|nr:HlyD family secretion protein [Phyllobacterium bourgognense]RCW78736.1 HlyD family secretion protein [Phyllobacterium bourgognense]
MAGLKPADIDQIHIGQRAELRFSAFNQRTTPEIAGYVKTVAADLLHNPQPVKVGISPVSKYRKMN